MSKLEHNVLPETAVATMADRLLTYINQDAICNELAEGFIAGIKDDNSRRSMAMSLTKSREITSQLVEIHRLLKRIEPYEAIVRGLVEQLHQQERLKRGQSAAA